MGKKSTETNKPAFEARLNQIRVSVWENNGDNGSRWFNTTISRLYKDGDDWKDSSSFGRDELLLAAKVLDQCHSWIFEQAATNDD